MLRIELCICWMSIRGKNGCAFAEFKEYIEKQEFQHLFDYNSLEFKDGEWYIETCENDSLYYVASLYDMLVTLAEKYKIETGFNCSSTR